LAPFSEAEIQALIAVFELARENKPADPEHLAEIVYFRKYRQDWSSALADLVTRGFMARQGVAYALTGRGAEDAARLR
jgi:hypothetical protein